MRYLSLLTYYGTETAQFTKRHYSSEDFKTNKASTGRVTGAVEVCLSTRKHTLQSDGEAKKKKKSLLDSPA